MLAQAGYEIMDNVDKEFKKHFLLTTMSTSLFLLVLWNGSFPLRKGKCSVLKLARHAVV